MTVKAAKACLTHALCFGIAGMSIPPSLMYGGDLTAFAAHTAAGQHFVQDLTSYEV